MITPRRTRVLRAPDLAGVRAHLVAAARDLHTAAADTFVLVPTRAAGEQLRRTLDGWRAPSAPAGALPLIGTRADLYAHLSARLPDPPRVLSAFEREVLLGAAARDAEDAGIPPPFHLRPTLVSEMLALYDHVRRQHRTLGDFERLLQAELEPAAESDRGARQLLAQTRFLAAAFRGYESRLADGGGVDEHGLRHLLVTVAAPQPVRRVIVTVGDRLSDAEGLWPADEALLTSIPGLDALDLAATEATLAAGLLDRWRMAFVGIEEAGAESSGSAPPTLVVPQPEPGGEAASLVFCYRDREDELEGVARRITAEGRACGGVAADRTALVVARPLPYLYLARDVFAGAGVPFETLDTLPLAAEPYAAALDLVLDCVAEDFTRGTLIALLRSPHFRFETDTGDIAPASVAAADRALAEVRYLGGLDRLRALAAEWGEGADGSPETRAPRAALPALQAAIAAASRLAPLSEPHPLTAQLGRLVAFLSDHDRAPATPAAERDRRDRVRGAVLGAITGLADAFRRHDPGAVGTVRDLTPALRRWLGTQTFALRTGAPGLQIVDVQSARFGEFDDVQVMGLVEGEWPERPRRNIFYPQSLLAPLEPARPEQVEVNRERDPLRAGRAMFHDLLRLGRLRTRVSTFALESDAVVEPSVLLDDIAGEGLPTETQAPHSGARVFAHEALALPPQTAEGLDGPAAAWARIRLRDLARDAARFHGEAGPWTLPRVSVSRLEQYLKCPFQFYAANVLRLEEEPGDEMTRSPLERGEFLHKLFEAFFHKWQRRGRGRITPDTLDEARALCGEIAEPALASLAPSEAGIERARLFGSAVGAGIAERVFTMEAERPVDIRERLMEYALDGVFEFAAEDGSTRQVRLRAKIDRVDLLADGTFRLIDYKTKFVLDRKLALQLPIYSRCVRERLSHDRGRDVPPGEAMYLSFEGHTSVVSLRARDRSFDELVQEAGHRLVAALDGIAAGHFPPKPHLKSLCGRCAFASVCRDRGSGSGIGDRGSGIRGRPND